MRRSRALTFGGKPKICSVIGCLKEFLRILFHSGLRFSLSNFTNLWLNALVSSWQLWSQSHDRRRFEKPHACAHRSRWFASTMSQSLRFVIAAWIDSVISLADVFKSVWYNGLVVAYSRSVDTQLINHILFIDKHFIWILYSELILWVFLHWHSCGWIIVVFKKTW